MTSRPWLLPRGSRPTVGEWGGEMGRGQGEVGGKRPLWKLSPEIVSCPVSGWRRWRDRQAGGCGSA